MFKDKLTLMLIPSSSGDSRQFRVSGRLLLGSAITIVVLVLSSIFVYASFFDNRVDQQEIERLRAENDRLMDRYEKMRINIAEIESRYQDLVDKEQTIRVAFDLPQIPSEERQLGVGGPISPAFARMSDNERIAYKTEQEVDRLLILSSFELEKYHEVEDALQDVKGRLSHTPTIWPTKGWLSRGFGMKHDPFTGYRQMHRGIDIANHKGTPVIATADGKVKAITSTSGLGKMVSLDHGYGLTTLYGHLSEIKVKRGQHVKRGDVIALMGSTGWSTGPHLHYEVRMNGRPVNPAKYLLNDK
jgi:murein DD-endopeptidase MepM/ murein hydrolase activator NlpD